MADYAELKSRFDELKAEGLKLNMMRGKPETKQVATLYLALRYFA